MPMTPHSSLSLSSSKGLVAIIMPMRWLLAALDQAVEVLPLLGVIPRILLRRSGFRGRLALVLQELLGRLLLELPARIGRRRRALVESPLGQKGAQDIRPARDQRARAGLLDDVGLIGLIGNRPGEEEIGEADQDSAAEQAEQEAERAVQRPEGAAADIAGDGVADGGADDQGHQEDGGGRHHIGQNLDGDVFPRDVLGIGETPDRGQGGRDPGADGEHLAHQSAPEGEEGGDQHHADDGEIDDVGGKAVQSAPPRGAPRPPSRAMSSERWAMDARLRPLAGVLRRPPSGGIKASVKPNFSASFRRWSIWLTGRTSPPRPISPKTTVPAGIGRASREERRAAATARSAAGSPTRKPPATFRYTS